MKYNRSVFVKKDSLRMFTIISVIFATLNAEAKLTLQECKFRSYRAPHSGSTEQTIPEIFEHHDPECNLHDINANLFYNLFIYGLLTLNRNRLLTNTGFAMSSIVQIIFYKKIKKI